MGMRIGGHGGGWANYQAQTSSINSHQQRQQGVKSLFSALQSGDVNAAQTAFTALQNQGLPANSPLNAIGQALKTGDLASAQKAAQSAMASRGRHHGGNDGDSDDAVSQASSASTASTASNAGTSAADPATAFAAFMQNLEAALEQQNPSTSASATSSTTSAATTATIPSTQAILWSQGSGFNQSTSDATLKADLDSLIQQMSSASSTSAAATDSTATASSTLSTADALQSSFSNLVGSLGGQSSSASVMNFLKSFDASLSVNNNPINLSA